MEMPRVISHVLLLLRAAQGTRDQGPWTFSSAVLPPALCALLTDSARAYVSACVRSCVAYTIGMCWFDVSMRKWSLRSASISGNATSDQPRLAVAARCPRNSGPRDVDVSKCCLAPRSQEQWPRQVGSFTKCVPFAERAPLSKGA